jgi:nicotinate dehydrogenase large molybdopterin subunit
VIVKDGEAARVAFTVNGRSTETGVVPSATLQHCLHHDLGFEEVRYGCGEGVCGACTILVDGEPRASCLMLAIQADGRALVTSAGVADALSSRAGGCARLIDRFVLGQAFQCGYCSCGVTVSAAHHLATHATPDASTIAAALSGHLCRCTGYRQMIEATLASARGAPLAADHVRRTDLDEKLGRIAGYATDRHASRPLVGRILWSQWPCARITAIDTSAAEGLPGVVAVLTHRHIPGRNRTGPTVFAADQPLLAAGAVKTMADAVALVAATDAASANEALQRIVVSYEPLPPVTSVFQSIADDAPRIARGGNVVAQFVESRGDVEAAFEAADVIVEDDYCTSSNDHGTLELEGGTGWIEGDTLVLAVPHQTPALGQRSVAAILGIPSSRVRIVAPRIGGSFGKYAMSTIEGYLALLVHHTRQPVRLVLGRDEMLQRRTKRHSSFGHYRLGLKRDGTFVAIDADVLTDAGPYTWLTPAVTAVMPGEASGAYDIPHVRARARGVLTNNLITAPMRGYGSQQIAYGTESIVEKAARTLRMDPAELRRKNFKTMRADGWGRPLPAADLTLSATLDGVLEALGPRPACPDGWLAGRGLSSVHARCGYPYGMSDRFVARIRVDASGQFWVESDLSDSGTAVSAEMVATAAAELGLPTPPLYRQDRAAIDDPTGDLFSRGCRPSWWKRLVYRAIEWIQVYSVKQLLVLTANLPARTVATITWLLAIPINFFTGWIATIKDALFPFGRDSFQPRFGASRASTLCTRAVHNAAGEFMLDAIRAGARALDIPEAELALGQDGVHHGADRSRSISWADLAAHAQRDIVGIGEARNPRGQLIDPVYGNLRGSADFMDATHGCDLAVNGETGEVRILSYVACHDVGHALNREAIRGQVLGGAAMGIGQALFEDVHVVDGKVLSAGFHDYLVPTALDLPAHTRVVILESGKGSGQSGAKGVGESAAVAAPIAVANALYDALGTQLKRTPATAEQILERTARHAVPGA